MIKIKEMSNILLNSSSLYDECGNLFKYLAEVRINFSSLKAHNVPWQLSQIVEIISSNKLDKNNLELSDIIINYCYNVESQTIAKKAIVSSFKSIFLITKIRNNKDKELLDKSDLYSIIDIYKKTYKVAPIQDTNIDQSDLDLLILLLNGKYSNNPLYFFPIFLLLIEELLKNFTFANSAKSTLINLYLIKNKLLFAPSICFSYPLLNFNKEYKRLLLAVKENHNEIINFSRCVFDLLKQASVVSRAFISDISNIKDKIETLLITSNKKNNFINNKQIIEMLKSIVFELPNGKSSETKVSEKEIKLTKFLLSNDLITEVAIYKNKTIYMFNNYVESINKLLKNKKEKTTKIFALKENLS